MLYTLNKHNFVSSMPILVNFSVVVIRNGNAKCRKWSALECLRVSWVHVPMCTCYRKYSMLISLGLSSAPVSVWNLRLAMKTVVDSDSVAVFKSRLKTFLFSRAFFLPFSQ